MRGEAAHESKPDPQRAPAPPVTTHRVYSDAPDPGAASGRLPPFRPGATAPTSPAIAAAPTSPAIAAVVESAEVNETDELLEMPLSADGRESSALPELGASAEDEPIGDEEPWDALGEALQVAVARANPPFAEDLVQFEDPGDRVVIEKPHEASFGPRTQQDEARSTDVEVEVAGPVSRPSGAKPQRDGFTEDLAATLESLAGSLRARGFNALDDAFARGGRLESALALFLAGYRAGRGE